MVVTNKVSDPQYPDLYLNGTKLQKVHSHKHLGVTLTSNMKWGVHIDAAIAKANKRLNGIRRIRFLIKPLSTKYERQTPQLWAELVYCYTAKTITYEV